MSFRISGYNVHAVDPDPPSLAPMLRCIEERIRP